MEIYWFFLQIRSLIKPSLTVQKPRYALFFKFQQLRETHHDDDDDDNGS